MKDISLSNKRIKIALFSTIAILFLVCLSFQHKNILLGFDDYGYGSLSYHYTLPDFSGRNYNFFQALEFLKGHYLNWGGRVLYFGLELLLLRSGIFWIRLVQVLIIFLISCVSFIYVERINRKFSIIAFFLCCLFFYLIQLDVCREGIYWFTASVLYLWPLLPCLIGIFLIFEFTDTSQKWVNWKKFLLYFCSFFATFSQEQISFSYMFMLGLCALFIKMKGKKISRVIKCSILISILGFFILYLAPGNSVRQLEDSFYQLNLIDKLTVSIPRFTSGFFTGSTCFFQEFLYCLCILCGIKMYVLKKGNKIFNCLFIIISFVLAFSQLVYRNSLYQSINYIIGNEVITNIIFILFMFVIMSGITCYNFLIHKSMRLLTLSLGAFVSIIPMLYAPYYVDRASIPLIFLMVPFLVTTAISLLDSDYILKIGVSILLLATMCICIWNGVDQYIGYRANSVYKIRNEETLLLASNALHNDMQIKSINLYKNLMPRYSCTMPYEFAGQGDIERYMKLYYNLPLDIEFTWIEP